MSSTSTDGYSIPASRHMLFGARVINTKRYYPKRDASYDVDRGPRHNGSWRFPKGTREHLEAQGFEDVYCAQAGLGVGLLEAVEIRAVRDGAEVKAVWLADERNRFTVETLGLCKWEGV